MGNDKTEVAGARLARGLIACRTNCKKVDQCWVLLLVLVRVRVLVRFRVRVLVLVARTARRW